MNSKIKISQCYKSHIAVAILTSTYSNQDCDYMVLTFDVPATGQVDASAQWV